jgi:cAMP-specific phosphodiesterase 4
MRKRIVDCVLATDMTLHNKEYSYIKLKLDTFNIADGENTDKIFENLDNMGIFSTQQEFLNTLIHTADISNPTKPLGVYEKWVNLVMEEFWLQGDKEKEMKLPVSFLCDRTTVKVPASQLGFMEGIVYPLVLIVVGLMPGVKFMLENINSNKAHYRKLKEEDDEKNKK